MRVGGMVKFYLIEAEDYQAAEAACAFPRRRCSILGTGQTFHTDGLRRMPVNQTLDRNKGAYARTRVDYGSQLFNYYSTVE